MRLFDRVRFGLTLGAAAGLLIAYVLANTKVPGFLLRVGGEFTTAVAVEVRHDSDEGDWVRFEFKGRDGQTYEGGWRGEGKVGDSVLVEYLPRNPKVNERRADRSLEPIASVIFEFVLFVALIVGCLWPSGLLIYRLIKRDRELTS